MLLILRLLSVIIGNTWVLSTISTVYISSFSSFALADTTSPLFQEILLIQGAGNGDNTFKKKNTVITIPHSSYSYDSGFKEIISKSKDNDTGIKGDLINADDLKTFVTQLEKQAQTEEKAENLPQIFEILNKKLDISYNEDIKSRESHEITGFNLNSSNFSEDSNIKEIQLDKKEEYELVSNDSSCLPADLSDITEDIVDLIAEGVEESLRLSDDNVSIRDEEKFGKNTSVETRQLTVYLFQGQYVPEPRLNRFIDGAIRNMGNEMRVAVMDPLFFRVLPRGLVASQAKPIQPIVNVKITNKRRPGRNRNVKRRRRQQKPLRFGNGNRLRKGNIFLRRKRQRQQQQRRKRQKQLQRQKQKHKQRVRIRQQQIRQQQIRQQQIRQQQKQNQRIRRRAVQNVGGGRVEGLSRVVRDGDAEMQLFGNYTLIRSHMKLGPVVLTMQFRTQRGFQRTGATLPVLRVHSVTRVNQEGSEMIDFLLDRPHPETIKITGRLFPLAERIAKNIFARLFLPESFLVQRVREKAGLALLSKPTE